jgi:hypothetical protein
LRGYAEGDFLGVSAGGINNQPNSYDFRQRVLYGEAKTNSGWTFAGGQLWSLATEGKKGISIYPGDNAGPLTIDPNNTVGFIRTRQYGFPVVKSFSKAAFAISVENPQSTYTASLAGNTPNAVLGSVGNATGNYNSTISSVTAITYVQNYKNAATPATICTAVVTAANPCPAGDSYTVTINTPYPVYNTLTAKTNVANYAFNAAPDVLFKAAFDPGFGHYEVFGIAGFPQETVYPNVTIDRLKSGGQSDIVNGANFGASIRRPTLPPHITTASLPAAWVPARAFRSFPSSSPWAPRGYLDPAWAVTVSPTSLASRRMATARFLPSTTSAAC